MAPSLALTYCTLYMRQVSALGGKLFSVSAWGADGTEFNHEALSTEVRALGGRVSATVHRKVAFLLATAEAVDRETQRVRKAWRFGVAVVRPEFLQARAPVRAAASAVPLLSPELGGL